MIRRVNRGERRCGVPTFHTSYQSSALARRCFGNVQLWGAQTDIPSKTWSRFPDTQLEKIKLYFSFSAHGNATCVRYLPKRVGEHDEIHLCQCLRPVGATRQGNALSVHDLQNRDRQELCARPYNRPRISQFLVPRNPRRAKHSLHRGRGAAIKLIPAMPYAAGKLTTLNRVVPFGYPQTPLTVVRNGCSMSILKG